MVDTPKRKPGRPKTRTHNHERTRVRPLTGVEIREKGKPGTKPMVFTAAERQQVQNMAGFGVPQRDIATILNIDVDTLVKHFRRELDLGVAKANSEVGQTLHQQALNGNTAAAIFWSKARMGWRETVKVESEISGPGGGPVQQVVLNTNDPVEAAKIYQKIISGG